MTSQISISYNSVAVPVNFHLPGGYSGSASRKFEDGYIWKKPARPPAPKKTKKLIEAPQLMRANKSNLTKKILAFFDLEKTKKFCAFYSISFPNGLSDAAIYQAWNITLTRIRQIKKNFLYIWVAERQKNGTLHYHLLTNEYLNVRIFNYFAAKAILTARSKNREYHINFDAKKYNGVDVRRVYSQKNIKNYITKYVTKNNTEMENRVWHCSREISALFTSYRTFTDLTFLKDHVLNHIYTVDIVSHGANDQKEIQIFAYAKSPPNFLLAPLRSINDEIIFQATAGDQPATLPY